MGLYNRCFDVVRLGGGLVWFGLVWFGLVWFGLVWLVWLVGLVWFVVVSSDRAIALHQLCDVSRDWRQGCNQKDSQHL
jgi:hypothetical protein